MNEVGIICAHQGCIRATEPPCFTKENLPVWLCADSIAGSIKVAGLDLTVMLLAIACVLQHRRCHWTATMAGKTGAGPAG